MSKQTLAQLLHQSALTAEQERQAKNRFDRICEAVKKNLAAKAKRAETSKPMCCPSCGEPLPESWRTDDVTGESDQNDDEDNEGDGAQPNDYDNQQAHRPFNGMTRDQVIASLGKIRC